MQDNCLTASHPQYIVIIVAVICCALLAGLAVFLLRRYKGIKLPPWLIFAAILTCSLLALSSGRVLAQKKCGSTTDTGNNFLSQLGISKDSSGKTNQATTKSGTINSTKSTNPFSTSKETNTTTGHTTKKSSGNSSGGSAGSGGTTSGGTTGSGAGAVDSVTGYTKPSDSNTGFKAAGLTLSDLTDKSSLCNTNTSYSSGYGNYVIITANNTTISNANIPCGVRIGANNVTIENSYISSNDYYGVYVDENSGGYTGTKIIKTEIFGNNNLNNNAAVSSVDYSVIDCNIHGWVDAFKADHNVIIKHNWIHDFNVDPGNTHNDGVQISYTGNVQIIGNKFESRNQVESSNMNASVFTNSAYGVQPSNILVEGNWINAGGWFIRVDATNFTIKNNRFGTWYGYGTLLIGSGTNSVWTQSGNVWDADGQPLHLPFP